MRTSQVWRTEDHPAFRADFVQEYGQSWPSFIISRSSLVSSACRRQRCGQLRGNEQQVGIERMNSNGIGAGHSELALSIQVRARKGLLYSSVVPYPGEGLQIARENGVLVRPALEAGLISRIEQSGFFRCIRGHYPYLPLGAIKLQECNPHVVGRPKRLLDRSRQQHRRLACRPI